MLVQGRGELTPRTTPVIGQNLSADCSGRLWLGLPPEGLHSGHPYTCWVTLPWPSLKSVWENSESPWRSKTLPSPPNVASSWLTPRELVSTPLTGILPYYLTEDSNDSYKFLSASSISLLKDTAEEAIK